MLDERLAVTADAATPHLSVELLQKSKAPSSVSAEAQPIGAGPAPGGSPLRRTCAGRGYTRCPRVPGQDSPDSLHHQWCGHQKRQVKVLEAQVDEAEPASGQDDVLEPRVLPVDVPEPPPPQVFTLVLNPPQGLPQPLRNGEPTDAVYVNRRINSSNGPRYDERSIQAARKTVKSQVARATTAVVVTVSSSDRSVRYGVKTSVHMTDWIR